MGAITGAIAGAFYGVPQNILEKGLEYLDPRMFSILSKFNQYVESKQNITV